MVQSGSQPDQTPRVTFSANLGFLWVDRTLPDAIRLAKAAGFSAVECHAPYAVPAAEVKAALDDTGLPMLGINTARGMAGEQGLAALAGREEDARASILQAIGYAESISAGAIHVLAGRAAGAAARAAFLANLAYARDACPDSITLLIEPLNRHDAPGYFLSTTDQARGIIEDLALPGVKMMFDCYHVGRSEGEIVTRLRDLMPLIGHIQFASVPDRGPPDRGEVNYRHVFSAIEALGWERPLGAEYRPDGETGASLGWMRDLV